MNPLDRLMDWYAAQCNGDWEHSFGVRIDTLDNPGWTLVVDLEETELHGKDFAQVLIGDSETDESWLHCRVEGGKFHAAGGVRDLPRMLESFLAWAGR